jgi:hypothetical protein
MQLHCWHLSEHLVLLALADDDIELELKSKILDKLLDSEVPDLFKVGKPDLPVVLMSTELYDLIGPRRTELAPFASGRYSQRGGVEVEKTRSQLVL